MIREFTVDELWFLLLAARWTVLLSAIAFARRRRGRLRRRDRARLAARAGRVAAAAYIKVVQGTPLLMQLYLVYFGASLLRRHQRRVDRRRAGPHALLRARSSARSGAAASRPSRASSGRRRGRWRSAYPSQLRLVILPQALRIALPPTVGFLVQLLKGTSLASIIGFTELTRAAADRQQRDLPPAASSTRSVAGLYFVLCWPLSLLSEHLERRLEQAGARTVAFQF